MEPKRLIQANPLKLFNPRTNLPDAGRGEKWTSTRNSPTTQQSGDSYSSGLIYAKNRATTQQGTSPSPAVGGYQISPKPIPPRWDDTIYDNDFPYNPHLEATQEDKDNWKDWGRKNFGASLPSPVKHVLNWVGVIPEEYSDDAKLGDLSDATNVYAHYRSGKGTDVTINLSKAYKNDQAVQHSIDKEIRLAQHAVEQLRQESGLDKFNFTGDLHVGAGQTNTENWQKTLGGFSLWSYGEVTHKNGEYRMTITVNSLDRYNFDKNKADIGTGTPDYINGRFEALGWAKSFNTKGETTFEVKWKEGEIPASTPQIKQGR